MKKRRGSTATRQALKERYSFLYTAMGRQGDPCFYCGLPADTLDHIPPLKAISTFGSDYFRELGVPFCTVPSCSECNSTLCARPLWDVDSRLDALQKCYKRRYFDLLDMPHWSLEELSELSGGLRVYVEEKHMLREVTLRRLSRMKVHRSELVSGQPGLKHPATSQK